MLCASAVFIFEMDRESSIITNQILSYVKIKHNPTKHLALITGSQEITVSLLVTLFTSQTTYIILCNVTGSVIKSIKPCFLKHTQDACLWQEISFGAEGKHPVDGGKKKKEENVVPGKRGHLLVTAWSGRQLIVKFNFV